MPRLAYSVELAEKICSLMLERNETGNVMCLRDICKIEDMPAEGTVYRWLNEHREFGEMYARAREEQAHLVAGDIINIADTEVDPNKARVRIDARKWYAAKLNKKDYGDRIDLGGDLTIKVPDDQLDARIAQLVGKAGIAGLIGREGAPEEQA